MCVVDCELLVDLHRPDGDCLIILEVRDYAVEEVGVVRGDLRTLGWLNVLDDRDGVGS